MAEEAIKGRGANAKLIALSCLAAAAIVGGYVWFAIATGGDAEQKQIAPETSAPQRAPSPDIRPVGYAHLRKTEPTPPAPQPLPPIRQEPLRQNTAPPMSRQPAAPPKPPAEAKKLPSMLFGDADFGDSRAADSRGTGVTMAASPGAQADQLPEYARQGLAQDKRRFLSTAGQAKGFVTNPLMPPISDMMLRAGVIVSVVTVNGVTTDLPGHIVGQVVYDVKDSITGTCTLIPATATLIGPVNHQVSYGAERMQPAWNRIMFPNGTSQDIDVMPATDATGKAGIEGRVNRHVGTMALAIVGDVALRVAGQAGQLFGSGGGETTIIGLGAGAAGGSVNEVGREIVRKELDRPNEITLEPGDAVSLMLIEDIALPPYDGECS